MDGYLCLYMYNYTKMTRIPIKNTNQNQNFKLNKKTERPPPSAPFFFDRLFAWVFLAFPYG